MAESGALERALEEVIRRAIADSLLSFRQQLREELRAELASALAGAGRSESPAVSASEAPAIPTRITPPSPGVSPLPVVHQSVVDILQPTGQADILSAFLQSAKGFAGRCALFVRREDSYNFWRANGFPAEAANRLRSVAVAATQPGIFKEISENRMAALASRSSESLTPALEQAVGEAAEETVYLFPIVVQGKVVAALYADAGGEADSVESAALEILATVAGLSLETSTARAASGVSAQSVPAIEAAQPVEAAPAPARSAEPMPDAPPEAAVAVIPPPPDVKSLPEADRDVHKKAYRRARVAVQDLLAYPQNQAKIEEGRNNKTLYRLLKEDIDKIREDYQKSFGQTAARSFDYLHYELVVKLAENDPDALGDQYPGPVGG